MKAKNLFKKSLALIIAMALIVLSVPMSIFMASAEATAAPTPDATDIGGKLVVSSSEALYNDFADDGVFTLGRTQDARFMEPVFGTGVVYASAKFKMNGNVHYNWSADGETGEYGYVGNYNNLGFDLGTATLGDGTSFVLHLSYRRNQGIYIMGDSSCSKFVKLSTKDVTANLDELVLTVKYDPATYTFSIWENGVQKDDISYADQVDPAATDATKIKSITMNHFGIHNSDLGYTAENPEDVTNGNKTENTVTVSDVHLWGDVTLSPKTATKAPTVGANSTDITANLTLSDATMNADWKDDGRFAWNVTQNQYYTFNGIDFTKGNNKIVYATATFTNRANGGDGDGIYGTVFTSAGDYNYLRPAWNQQGLAKYNAQQLVGNVVPEGNGTLAGDVWKATYKWDVDNDTVDIWLTTQFHQGDYNIPQGYGFNATFYVGKFYLKDCAPQFGLRTRPEAPQLTGTVNVQDVMVWEETAAATEGGSTTNVANTSDVLVGGTMTAGTGGAVLTTVPNFGIGTTLDTDGVYDATGSGVRTRKTVYWDGLIGNLSKGTITFEADLTATTPASSWERHSGFTVAIVDGHYVTAGVGVHNSDNKYRPYTFINGGNLNEGSATQTVLGGSASMSVSGQAITVTDEGTVIKLKVVLSNEVLMFYVNGKLEQYYDLTNKDVVPFFGFLWQSGKAADNISNVKIYGDGVWNANVGENLMPNVSAFEGGKLDAGLKYNETAGYGTTNVPTWTKGSTPNYTGVYTSLQQTGYHGLTTVNFDGLKGDLSKGNVVYEADFTIYNKTSGWNGTNWGLIVATVDGHYVHTGFGIHGGVGATYKNATVVDGGNVGEQAGCHANLLGQAWGGSYTVTGTEEGVTVHVKAVLSANSLTTYINGAVAQSFSFAGKTVVPQFGIAWGSGNAKDTISNVRIYGAGVYATTQINTYTSADSVDSGLRTTINPTYTYVTNVAYDNSFTATGTISLDSYNDISKGDARWTPGFIIGTSDEGVVGFRIRPHWYHAWLGIGDSIWTDALPEFEQNYHQGSSDAAFDPRGWKTDKLLDVNASSYDYEYTYNNGRVTLVINGAKVIDNYDVTAKVTNFKPVVGAEYTCTEALSATNPVVRFSASVYDVESVKPYLDENGNAVHVTGVDTEAGDVYVKVETAEGYVVKAGSLKLGDRNIINGVNTPENAESGIIGDGVSYVVANNGGTLSATFVAKTESSFSTAVLGAQLHRNGSEVVDGIRFLNRFYIDGLTRDKLQAADALTVTVNGNTYTVTDYGILAQAASTATDLTVDAYKWKASGLDMIFSYSDNYIDISATIMARNPSDAFYAKEYEFKGYVVLSNGDIIYSDTFTACINDYMG